MRRADLFFSGLQVTSVVLKLQNLYIYTLNTHDMEVCLTLHNVYIRQHYGMSCSAVKESMTFSTAALWLGSLRVLRRMKDAPAYLGVQVRPQRHSSQCKTL